MSEPTPEEILAFLDKGLEDIEIAEAQRQYRAQCAADAAERSMPDDDRQRMLLIALGKPEELLQRLRREDPDNVWTPERFSEEFDVHGFMAPFVRAKRRSDGQEGMLMFTHLPRFYFGWLPR